MTNGRTWGFCEKLRVPRFLFPVGGAKLLEERENQSESLLKCLSTPKPWRTCL